MARMNALYSFKPTQRTTPFMYGEVIGAERVAFEKNYAHYAATHHSNKGAFRELTTHAGFCIVFNNGIGSAR
jgi:hypothetical protein